MRIQIISLLFFFEQMGLITVEQQEELLDFEDRMWTKCPTDWGACEEVKFESKCPSNKI